MTVDFQMTEADIQKMASVLLAVLLPEIEKRVAREPTRTMSKQEAIDYLPGVSRESFEEICRVHKIGVKVGTRWVYTNTELDKLLEDYKGKVLI
ncbi:MAG: hypothetical protein HY818_05310 [Acetobacterium woodii]|nr:hypothetical protein [Acetobacterium woodii]